MTVYPETIDSLRNERNDQAERLVASLRANERLRGHLATLRTLLREAAHECEFCDSVAILVEQYTDPEGDTWDRYACETHAGQMVANNPKKHSFRELNLGVRIKAALDDTP